MDRRTTRVSYFLTGPDWAARIARRGPAEGLRVADELRRQVLSQDPAWPSPDLRAARLAAHARLAALFRRADAARRT